MAVRLLKNYIASYSDQVPYYPSPLSSKSLLQTNLSSNKPLLSPPISVFLSLSLVQVGRFFSSTISTFYDLSVFLLVPLISWKIFYWLIPYPVFLLSLSISELGGFSPATWPFETHQLPHKARMFSVVFWFSSPVSLISLEGFSPSPHFLLTIPRSTELASKERSNCNNMTLEAESSRSKSYMTTIIQILPWSVWLPPQRLIKSGSHLESSVPFLIYALDFSTYALDFSTYVLEHLCTKLK